MMYSEFAEAVGCRDNDHNHKVFENLEAMYMNTDMSKEEIYEYGRKLVDNSKSKEQLELEAKIKAEIEEKKGYIEEYKEDIKRFEFYLGIETDDSWKYEWKTSIAYRKDMIKKLRNKIVSLKWVLEE